MRDLPTTLPVVRSTKPVTAVEFDRQRQSISRRRTNASVLGVIVLPSTTEIALVNRTIGSHIGLALPSGSVEPGETFCQAFDREMSEELGIEISGAHAVQIEQRTFESSTDRQHIYVATFMARLAMGQEVHQTDAATREGIVATVVPLSDLPQVMAFENDLKKIHDLPQLLAA